MRRLLAVLALSCAALFGIAQPAVAYPPTPPSPSDAATMLNALTVAAPLSMDGYSRDRFPHWISQGNNCDTREVVLERDGSGVTTGSDCYPTSGSWYSVYDGVWVESASDVDIDHMVPLADAWRSGAKNWTDSKRQDFANDLTNDQLIAVSASSNRSKGDQDPSTWKPTNTNEWCYYARYWIQSKTAWALTITDTEKSALSEMLGTC